MCAYMKTTRLSMAKLPTKLSLKVEQRSKIGKLLKQQGAASGFYSYAILENMVDSRWQPSNTCQMDLSHIT